MTESNVLDKAATSDVQSKDDVQPIKIASKTLNAADQKKFYSSLLTKNYTQAAEDIGLGSYYANKDTLRTKGREIYSKINPYSLGLSDDLIEGVKLAIENRKVSKGMKPTEGQGGEVLDPNDTKQMVVGGQNKALSVLHKKFDHLNKDKKALKDTSLSQIATAFGILFDKSQIIKGESTENIAVMAKINKDMSPDESLDALLKMREKDQEDKYEG